MDRASVQFQTKNSKPAALQGKSEALPLQTDLWNSQVEVFFFSACLQTATDGPGSAGAVSTTSSVAGAEISRMVFF